MNNANAPRNAAEAIAQANRFDRAKQLLTDGYQFHKDPDSEVVAVIKPGTTAAAYWLNMITDGCDCPDFLKNNQPCKHMMAWQILQEREQAERDDNAAMWAEQCRRHDAEHGSDCPPADTTRALMLAELRRAERNLAACHDDPFSTRADSIRKRLQDCQAALKLYDEVVCKQAIDFYKRGLDKPTRA